MCDSLRLACAVCRIGLYSVFRRICCSKAEVIKPEYNPICIGLTKSGKTTVLALISGEKATDVEPTVGFSIKAILFDDCILNVKEIGGAANIRPYWRHYYKGAHGVIFIIDASSNEEEFSTAKNELEKALRDPALGELPCLILATHSDVNSARSETELKELLDVDDLFENRPYIFGLGSINDVDTIRTLFIQFNQSLHKRYSRGNTAD
ncbi:ADP-ribosylation factor-like protein 15 [Tubulanus polymorphus]|uniref:ADP-ribosylation factor-like protein 15 n=1 Tax=Tubulanus polymorphus TaxID=672921 RepID=UPI003DA2AE38